jgi:hypothetical protein
MTDDAEVSPGALVRTLLGIGPRETHATGRCSDLTDEQLSQLVEHVKTPNADLSVAIDVAAVALKMRPWPTWVMGVLYPSRTSRP